MTTGSISSPSLSSSTSSHHKENEADNSSLPQRTSLSQSTTAGGCDMMTVDAAATTTSRPSSCYQPLSSPLPAFVRPNVRTEIVKQVLRQKLSKLRHLVLYQVFDPDYLDCLFPEMLRHFHPQTVHYNGGIAHVTEWKISTYLEVMPGGVPTTNPSIPLLELFRPLLQVCDELFLYWYRQQHAANSPSPFASSSSISLANPPDQRNPTKLIAKLACRRLMTFITQYRPIPGQDALLKHVDGAGQVDGSIVVALPMDRWSAPLEQNAFEGGGLTFWDGPRQRDGTLPERHYDTRSGDVAFLDRAVWHQADPITKGKRWALVIFYKVEKD